VSASGAGPRIAVVDYGAGNLVSIDQGLRAVGADVVLVRSPDALDGADGLIVPGVGAARPAMNRLRRRGLLEPIVEWARADRPYLGICLGLQLLFEASDEDGARTFGLLPGRTVRLEDAPRLPHIGWNQVEWRRPEAPDPLFDGIADGANFYFVHSYAGRPGPGTAPGVVVAETTHGGTFVSAVRRGNLFGVQFHPERSGRDGLRLLANFVRSLESVRLPLREEVAA
jgi:imidazole glycerol phosphate synthase glutamine amidotransferase subunit